MTRIALALLAVMTTAAFAAEERITGPTQVRTPSADDPWAKPPQSDTLPDCGTSPPVQRCLCSEDPTAERVCDED